MAITPTAKSQNPFDVDLGARWEAATRIREFNERLIDSSNAAGHTALKAYEETLKRLPRPRGEGRRRHSDGVGVRPGPDVGSVPPRRECGLPAGDPRTTRRVATAMGVAIPTREMGGTAT
jgi:hypothetical protein